MYAIQNVPLMYSSLVDSVSGRRTQFSHVRVDWMPRKLRSPGGVRCWVPALGRVTSFVMDEETWDSARLTDIFVRTNNKNAEYLKFASVRSELWGISRKQRNHSLSDLLGRGTVRELDAGGPGWLSLTYFNLKEEKYCQKDAAELNSSESGGDDRGQSTSVAAANGSPDGKSHPLIPDDEEREEQFQDVLGISSSCQSPEQADNQFDLAKDDTPGDTASGNKNSIYGEEEDWVLAFRACLQDNKQDVVPWETSVISAALRLSLGFQPYVTCADCDLAIAHAQMHQEADSSAPAPEAIPPVNAFNAQLHSDVYCHDCGCDEVKSFPGSHPDLPCRTCIGVETTRTAYQSRIGGSCYEDYQCPGFHAYPYDSKCAICAQANKMHRPHLRSKNKRVEIGGFSCDLIERRSKQEVIQFLLLGTSKTGDPKVRNITVVIELANKAQASLERGIRLMLLQAEFVWGAAPISRFHSDKEPGILANHPKLHELGIATTTTEGDDPQANGAAEGAIAIVTRGARSNLLAALRGLSEADQKKAASALFHYAAVHAAAVRSAREWEDKRQNDHPSMKEPRVKLGDILPFGAKVVFRTGAKEKPERDEPIGIPGWYLHPDHWVPKGSKVFHANSPYSIETSTSVSAWLQTEGDPTSWIFPTGKIGLPPLEERGPDFKPSPTRKWIECSRCHKWRGVSPDLLIHLSEQNHPFECCHLAKDDGSRWKCKEAEEEDAWDDLIASGGKKPKKRTRIEVPQGVKDKAKDRWKANNMTNTSTKWHAPLPRPQKIVSRFYAKDGTYEDVKSDGVVSRSYFLPEEKEHLWKTLDRRETIAEDGTILDITVKGRGRKPNAFISTDQGDTIRIPCPNEEGEDAHVKWSDLSPSEREDVWTYRRNAVGRLSRILGVTPSEIPNRTCEAYNAMLDWSSTEESIRQDEADDDQVEPSERTGDREEDLGPVGWVKYRPDDLKKTATADDVDFKLDPLRFGWHDPLPDGCSGNIRTELTLDDGSVYTREDKQATVYRTVRQVPDAPDWRRVRKRKTYDLGAAGGPKLMSTEHIAEKSSEDDLGQSAKLETFASAYIGGQAESDGKVPSPVAFVHQMLKLKDAKSREKYSATVGLEIGRMLQFDTWGKPVARSSIPGTAWVYRVHMLYGIKNAEHPERAKDKARLVLQGNLRFTKEGKLKLDRWFRTPGEFWAPASSMAGFRLVASIGAILGYPVQTIDLDAAYLQSKVRGEAIDFLELSPEIIEGMTPDWQKLVEEARKRDIKLGGDGSVVFPLLRNMYGKTTSGFNFIGDLQSDLEALGWTRMPHCFGSFYKRCKVTGQIQVLANYVDDFAAALNPASAEAEWKAIGGPDGGEGGWVFDPPRNVDRFLGIECRYPVVGEWRYVVLEQIHYMNNVLSKYEELRGGGFKITKYKHLPKDEPPLDLELKHEAGTVVRSVLGGLMYAARGTRPDIIKACHSISRRVTRWCPECQKFLDRVLGYVAQHINRGLSFDCRKRSSDISDWSIHAFVDSSLDVPWSQSGVIVCIAPRLNDGDDGPFLVLDYSSSGQQYVKLSPAESETVGLVQAARGALRYLFSWEVLAPRHDEEQDCVFVHVDNAQAQAFAERGWSSALVHVARTYACNVLWVTERIRQGFFKILHEPTARMLVDPLTKLMDPLQLIDRGVLIPAEPVPVSSE